MEETITYFGSGRDEEGFEKEILPPAVAEGADYDKGNYQPKPPKDKEE